MSPTRPPVGSSRRKFIRVRHSNLLTNMNDNQEQLINNRETLERLSNVANATNTLRDDEDNRLASEMSREEQVRDRAGGQTRTQARSCCDQYHRPTLGRNRIMNRRRRCFEKPLPISGSTKSQTSTLFAISTTTSRSTRNLLLALTSCLLASVTMLALLGHQIHAAEQLPVAAAQQQQQQNVNKLQQASFQQLIKSADVELTRRSLQRSQRDAVQASAATTSTTTTTNNGNELVSSQQHAATCGYPGSPAHASVTFNTSHVVAGTAASYTCDNGYELLGPPRRICQANGTWSPVGIPFCVLNVGLGKAAMQSSTAGGGSAQKAVDGSTSPYFQAGTCTMTDVEHNPWWYVNLLEPYLVQIVRIDFGTACCANRQKATIAVRVGNNRPDLGTNPLCNRYHGYIEEGKPLFLPCTRPAPGAFVSIHLESPSGSALSICETFIYTDHALSIEQCPSFRDQPLGSTATYNGKCYLFHNNQALGFEPARKYCESRGGTLVDETSPALQGFLSWELYRRHRNDQLMGQYWLGAVRDARNGQNWKWINGRDVQISFWNSLTSTAGGGGNCSRFDGSKGWLWSDTDCAAQLNFICQYRPLSCGKPEKPTNSTLITKNIDNGTVIEYQCTPGNLLMGPKSRVCLPTGFFSEFAPKCKYLDCQPPAMIGQGDYKLLNGTTSYKSLVTYHCNDGHQLYGRSTLTCDVDERWDGPPPRCEPLLCPAPVAPSNGYVTVTSNITIPGTQATYDCRPGYELVGDRLLSCLNSGSWDQSFPYCREKRQLLPHTLAGGGGGGQPPTGQVGANQAARQPQQVAAISTTPPSSASRQQPLAPSPKPAGSNVQFPGSSSTSGNAAPSPTAFSSNRVAPQPPASSASNSPASLNGLAGLNQPTASQLPVAPSSHNEIQSSTGGTGDSQPMPSSRRPSAQQPAPPPLAPSIELARQQPPARGPQSGSSLSSAVMSPPPPMIATPRPASPVSASTPNSNNRFTFAPAHQQPTSPLGGLPPAPSPTAAATSGSTVSTSGHYGHGGDSSPLATTNSISVSGQHGGQHGSSSEAPQSHTPSSSSTPPFAQSSTPSGQQQHHHLGHAHQHPHHNQANMATSGISTSTSAFGLQQQSLPPPPPPPVRASSHNSLANSRNSLDGIIAMAIIGSILFLGTVITILVIIVRRRKSGHSSTIDAQTISTYQDSNGHEQNGLYRNYQQAWENLRFSAPSSQPKSSGNGPHPSAVGPAMGMKNYAPSMLHHAHPIHTGGVAPGGRQNLGMSSSSTTSSSSHHSSSSLGITGAAGSGGADPLLGPNYLGHQHHNPLMSAHHSMVAAHHHCVARDHVDEDDDDDDCDEDEHGVISADETTNYHPHHAHHMHALGGGRSHQRSMSGAGHHLNAEGFRDSNELTINAEMAPAGAGQQARRRLYSTNSISRSMAAAAAANRRSIGNLAAGAASAHSNGGHQMASTANRTSTSSSNTTSGGSTHSSRASPPSGHEDELDRLAYGNNWQQR